MVVPGGKVPTSQKVPTLIEKHTHPLTYSHSQAVSPAYQNGTLYMTSFSKVYFGERGSNSFMMGFIVQKENN